MILSTRFKEAIKTALAMTIAYGIALSMDWDKPYWAAFAVAFISLATVGQSLNKGVLRMVGTFAAAIVALTLITLFAQDRWPFILFLSAWVGLCTYMMGSAKHQYFWSVGGFVCVIIAMDAGPNSINAFDLAVMRVQETGLGILVYSLVSILLWPSNSRAEFDAATGKLASTQHRLYQAYFGLMQGQGSAADAQTLKARELQEQTLFGQLLDAAQTDSYEVWELRRQWRRYQRQETELTETLERWRESFTEVQTLDLHSLLPNLTAFGAELDLRFTQIERMLANQAPERRPTAMDLTLDETKALALSHCHKAALTLTRSRLQRLERLTSDLFDSLSDTPSRTAAPVMTCCPLSAPPSSGSALPRGYRCISSSNRYRRVYTCGSAPPRRCW